MSAKPLTFSGRVRGKVIELDSEPGLPDGQEVTVSVQLPDGDEGKAGRLAALFGACADEADDLDEFVRQVRRDRDADRRGDIDALPS